MRCNLKLTKISKFDLKLKKNKTKQKEKHVFDIFGCF